MHLLLHDNKPGEAVAVLASTQLAHAWPNPDELEKAALKYCEEIGTFFVDKRAKDVGTLDQKRVGLLQDLVVLGNMMPKLPEQVGHQFSMVTGLLKMLPGESGSLDAYLEAYHTHANEGFYRILTMQADLGPAIVECAESKNAEFKATQGARDKLAAMRQIVNDLFSEESKKAVEADTAGCEPTLLPERSNAGALAGLAQSPHYGSAWQSWLQIRWRRLQRGFVDELVS